MSLYDLELRAQAVRGKYEKYDAEFEAKASKSTDPFTDEYFQLEAEVEKLAEAAEEVQLESSRAVIAGMYAEIRRAKNVLLTDAIDSLNKKVKKGKGVTKQQQEERLQKIEEMIDRIYAIPDGMHANGNKRPQRYGSKSGAGSKANPITLSHASVHVETGKEGYHSHTLETQAFEKHTQSEFVKQDQKLDIIGVGVERLKQIAGAMKEEVDRHEPILDDIEKQMNKVADGLKGNNAKLKGVVHRMRSSRNFCVDAILICVLLAIGSFIFATFNK